MGVLPEHLRALLTAEPYPHPVSKVRLIETHVSWVFLTGEYAYKVKRPVWYPFVDLRSIARRAFLCEEELRLNGRFSPELYLEVCCIRGRDGRISVGGEGEILEYAVRMRQFDVEDVLNRLLSSGRVEPMELERFGRALARQQESLPVARSPEEWGSPHHVKKLVMENLAQCVRCFAPLGTQGQLKEIVGRVESMLQDLEPLLALRRDQGRVRECHGDLHSANVVRYQGRLIPFDCMEFEPAFRWIDVAEEVAFLWMDLHALAAPGHAHAFLAGFLVESGDYAACRLLRLYSIHRALVRAKVAALEVAGASDTAARDAALARHHAYLSLVRELPGRPRQRLLLMSGLSGSGKTWLASQLAELLGAIHLRSDVERKRGVVVIDQDLYSPASRAQVMEHLRHCAEDALAGGFSVVVDATFSQRRDRETFQQLATARGIDLRMVSCHAPRAVLEERIRARQREGRDPSDADLSVLDWQESHFEALLPDEGIQVVDADTTEGNIARKVAGIVSQTPASQNGNHSTQP